MIKNVKRTKKKGQALVLGIFSLLPMALFLAMIVNTALVMEHKRNLQNAADRAAAAGAIVQADMLSSMAWINLALADVYTQSTKLTVHFTSLAPIAEMAQDSADAGQPLPSALSSYSNVVTDWNTAFNKVQTETDNTPEDSNATVTIPRGKAFKWQRRLQGMQATIGALAGDLIKRQIWRTANANLGFDMENSGGTVHVNLFPYHARYVPSGHGAEQWRITPPTSNDYSDGFTLNGLSAGVDNQMVDLQISGNDGEYPITYNTTIRDQAGNVESHTITFEERTVSGSTYLYITLVNNTTGETNEIYWDDDRQGWVVNGVFAGEGDNGGVNLDDGNTSNEYRRDPDTGDLQVYEDGDWRTVGPSTSTPGGVGIPTTVNVINVGGIDFTVNMSNVSFGLGGVSITFNPDGKSATIEGRVSNMVRLSYNSASAQPRLNDWCRIPDSAGDSRLFDRSYQELLNNGDMTYDFNVETIGDYVQQDTNNERFAIRQALKFFDPVFPTGSNVGEGQGIVDNTWLYNANEVDGTTYRGWYEMSSGNLAQEANRDHENHLHHTITNWHQADAHCPVHGANCPGNNKANHGEGALSTSSSQIDGGWHFTRTVRVPNPGGSPPFTLVTTTHWQVCPLCTENPISDNDTARDVSGSFVSYDQCGRRYYAMDYDNDGQADVRRYPESNIYRDGRGINFRHYLDVSGTGTNVNYDPIDFDGDGISDDDVDGDGIVDDPISATAMAVGTPRYNWVYGAKFQNSTLRYDTGYDDTEFWRIEVPRRLVLSEDFFRWGINLAVHDNRNPTDNFILPTLFSSIQDFSPIATASARCGFLDPETNRLRFRWPTRDEADEWADGRKHDINDSYASPYNLIVTDWVPKMTSTRDNFRLEDLEHLDNYSTTTATAYDTPGTMLIKHYLWRGDGQWRHIYNGTQTSGNYTVARRGRNRHGQSWNMNTNSLSQMQAIDRWIKH